MTVKPVGHLDHRVAVTHPAGQFGGNTGEQRALPRDSERPAAVLGQLGPRDPSAAELGDQLQPVADAQDGHAQFEEARIGQRRVGLVDAARARPRGSVRPGRRARISATGVSYGISSE